MIGNVYGTRRCVLPITYRSLALPTKTIGRIRLPSSSSSSSPHTCSSGPNQNHMLIRAGRRRSFTAVRPAPRDRVRVRFPRRDMSVRPEATTTCRGALPTERFARRDMSLRPIFVAISIATDSIQDRRLYRVLLLKSKLTFLRRFFSIVH